MKVLAIAIVSASCVVAAPQSKDPGVDPGADPGASAPDLGEITVVAAPGEPPRTPRSSAILQTYDDDTLEMHEVSRDVNVTATNSASLIGPLNSR